MYSELTKSDIMNPYLLEAGFQNFPLPGISNLPIHVIFTLFIICLLYILSQITPPFP